MTSTTPAPMPLTRRHQVGKGSFKTRNLSHLLDAGHLDPDASLTRAHNPSRKRKKNGHNPRATRLDRPPSFRMDLAWSGRMDRHGTADRADHPLP